MSIESLRSEIDFVLANSGTPWPVGRAAITEFLRGLHEVMTKSGRKQSNLLAQVQTVLGSTAMHHLARVLEAKTHKMKNLDDCPLEAIVHRICHERGISVEDGQHLFAHFLKALDEERVNARGDIESETAMVYFAIGGEAAYHLGGLHVGDLGDMVATSLGGYLDPQLRRFHKIVQIWELELAWEKEAEE